MDDLAEQLARRFKDAVAKSFPQPPLVGPNWLRPCRNQKPADFAYIGVPKLAKATGKNAQQVAKLLLKNLDRRGLNADVRLGEDLWIYIDLRPGGSSSDEDGAP